MKSFPKFTVSALCIVFGIVMSSCGKDACYDCTHTDPLFQPITICEGDVDIPDEATLDVKANDLELLDYDCKKQ